jgi:GT2 family glycosyltransferase
MADQAYSKQQFEVIVVDDGSPIPAEPVVAPFRACLNLTLLRKENGGPSSARNAGAFLAKGRFLAFTDDDCAPERNWLDVLGMHFSRHPDCVLGGRTINRLVDNLYAVSSQILADMVFEFHKATVKPEVPCLFAANNLAVSADDFARIGGFNETFRRAAAEDREFCLRWGHSGRRMIYVPEAIVQHAHHLNLSSFCRQHFAYGRGAFAYQKIRLQLGLGKLFGLRGFHAQFLKLSRPLLKQLPPCYSTAVGCLLLLSQLSTAAGFACEACALLRFPRNSTSNTRPRDSNSTRGLFSP